MTIEVILNNKIYVPIKRNITIINSDSVKVDIQQPENNYLEPNNNYLEPKVELPSEFPQEIIAPEIPVQVQPEKLNLMLSFENINKPVIEKKTVIPPISESKIGTKIPQMRKLKPREQFDFTILEGKVIFK